MIRKFGILVLLVALVVGTIYFLIPDETSALPDYCQVVLLKDCTEVGGTLGMSHCDYKDCKRKGTHQQLCTYCSEEV